MLQNLLNRWIRPSARSDSRGLLVKKRSPTSMQVRFGASIARASPGQAQAWHVLLCFGPILKDCYKSFLWA